MTRLLAIAELRLKEGLAARLAWLVPLAFAVGFGAAMWAQGPNAAARAATADRIALWTAWGLALVVAAVVPALGLPSDIRSGAAETLFSSPVSRFQIVLGGTLGYGALSAALLVSMAGAATLGMQAAGIGPAQREPVRSVAVAEAAAPAADGTAVVDDSSPTATFRFRMPAGLALGEPLRARLAPQSRVETTWETASVASIWVHRPDGDEGAATQVAFKAGTAFTAYVPQGGLSPGEDAELTFRRTGGGRSLVFRPGSVEIGGESRLFALSVVTASFCAVPFLLLLAAIGSLGAARFGAPTAVIFAAFLFLILVGRDVILAGAEFVVSAAADPTLIEGHAHGEPGYAPPAAITPTRLFLSKTAIAAFEYVPRYDAFDRTDSLVERRAPTAGDVGRAASQGLPAVAVATIAGWLLLRRRELTPG